MDDSSTRGMCGRAKKERRHLSTFWLSKRSVHPDIPIDLRSNIDIIYAMNTHHMYIYTYLFLTSIY